MKALLFLMAVSAFAQAPANWAGAGGSYNPSASPSGWIAYATLLSEKGPVYSYSEVAITNAQTKGFKPQTSVTTGAATTLKTMGKFSLFGLATAGMATSATATGSAFSGGGVALWRINPQWSIVLGAQVLKTTAQAQAVLSFGFGHSW